MQKILIIIGLILCCSTIAYAKKNTDAVFGPEKTISFKGSHSTYMIDTGVDLIDGDVWVWGYKLAGASGNGHNIDHTSYAERVNYFYDNNIKVVDIAATAHNILALDEYGDVWGWGQNLYLSATGGVCTTSLYINLPCKVLSGKNVIQIGGGEYYSVALTADGKVYTWGHGIYGQVPNGLQQSSNNVYQIPQSNFGGEKVVYIGDGYETAYAITESGDVYGWGDNEAYAFGYSTSYHEYVSIPKRLSFAHDDEINYMCNPDLVTLFLTRDGSVYGMGNKIQLGVGVGNADYSKQTTTPTLILDDVDFLACRYAGAIAKVGKKIYTWGSNGGGYPMLYSSYPVSRPYNGEICRIVPSKDRWLYWTTTGELYGVGYAGGLGALQGAGKLHQWPGILMTDVMNSLKAAYGSGEDYIDKVCGY